MRLVHKKNLIIHLFPKSISTGKEELTVDRKLQWIVLGRFYISRSILHQETKYNDFNDTTDQVIWHVIKSDKNHFQPILVFTAGADNDTDDTLFTRKKYVHTIWGNIYIYNIFIHAFKYIVCWICIVLNMVHIYKQVHINR